MNSKIETCNGISRKRDKVSVLGRKITRGGCRDTSTERNSQFLHFYRSWKTR